MRNFTILLLLVIIINSLSIAQLTKLTGPNMLTEADIYKNTQGVMYSNNVKFGFSKKMVEIMKGVSNVDINKIKYNAFKNKLTELNIKYGNFSIRKVNPSIQWGDTIRVNRRTKKLVSVPDLSQEYIIEFQKLVPYDTIAAYIKKIKNVKYAEGPLIAYLASTNPNDPWYYNNSSQGPYRWSFDVIHAQDAWDITKGSPLIRVGIDDRFDSTISLHDEIASKVVWESSWNLNGHHGDHGTMSAGIVGATTNNNTDIASLGWNTSLMLAEWYPYSNITQLVDSGADVINFSWVSLYYSYSLENEIRYALAQGVICVASAGNNELPLPGVRYPAAFNFDSLGQVIAVSGTEMVNGIEQFIEGFNYSPGTDPINDPTNAFIDCAAPGTNYRSLSWNSITGTRHIWSGTSISAPFVSALVGLMLSVDSTLTPVQVYNIITSTSDKIGQYPYDSNGWNRYMGYGRIDAANAVNVAKGAPTKPRNLKLKIINYHPHLTWSQNLEPDLDGYYIYRTENTNPVEQIAYIPKSAQRLGFTDTQVSTVVQPDNISYTIKAKDTSSLLSVNSDNVSVMGILMKPFPETELKITQNNNSLNQNYPNPFNPSTEINYSLKKDGIVVIKVFDVLGKEVAFLKNKYEKAGNYSVNFNAADLPSGIYFYRITAGNFQQTKKMLLLK